MSSAWVSPGIVYVYICFSRKTNHNCSERCDFWATAKRVIYPDQMTSVDCSFTDFRDALVSNATVSRISL